jgi:hypothetical protein
MKSRTSGMGTIKTSVGDSDDDVDKEPSRKIIEKTPITYIPVKRKRNISPVGINTPEVLILW